VAARRQRRGGGAGRRRRPPRTAATDAWINARGWWFPDRHPATIESLGRREADGAAFDVLRCVPAGGQWVELWFDASSHLLARLVQEVLGKPSCGASRIIARPTACALPFRIASGNGDPRFDRVTEIARSRSTTTPPADVRRARSRLRGRRVPRRRPQARLAIDILNNHVFVAVEIAGHPLRFLLDTGGVNLLTTRPRRAHRPGQRRRARGARAGREVGGSGFARVERLVIGGAVALERQLLRVLDMPGFDDVEGVPVDGVLGVELFKRLVVQDRLRGARTAAGRPATSSRRRPRSRCPSRSSATSRVSRRARRRRRPVLARHRQPRRPGAAGAVRRGTAWPRATPERADDDRLGHRRRARKAGWRAAAG
jgi:hypothetical protein